MSIERVCERAYKCVLVHMHARVYVFCVPSWWWPGVLKTDRLTKSQLEFTRRASSFLAVFISSNSGGRRYRPCPLVSLLGIAWVVFITFCKKWIVIIIYAGTSACVAGNTVRPTGRKNSVVKLYAYYYFFSSPRSDSVIFPSIHTQFLLYVPYKVVA